MARRYFASSSLQGRRRSVLRGQIANLIIYGSITTTEARAKTLKTEVERFISRVKSARVRSQSKPGDPRTQSSGQKVDLVTRRKVLAFLPRKEAVQRLFEQVIPQFENRVGGYVRVVKLPPRRGDNAPMARVEFVEEIKKTPKVSKAKEETKTVRSKGRLKDRGKKKDEKNKSDKGK